jgi:hypothetical protein
MYGFFPVPLPISSFLLITPIKLDQDTYNEVPPQEIFSFKWGTIINLRRAQKAATCKNSPLHAVSTVYFVQGILHLLPH